MTEQKSGTIINISWSTAYWGTPNFQHYVALKAALIGMTRSLAREAGGFGVCVNAIAPGLMEHEWQHSESAVGVAAEGAVHQALANPGRFDGHTCVPLLVG